MMNKIDLPNSSCWVVTEGLIGLRNQATGLAEALGVPYTLKEVRQPKSLWQLLTDKRHITPPWPDMLISCGRRSVAASVAVRRASGNKTFTVHIQHPLINTRHFDLVIAPAHDKLRGDNVFVTQGALHHVTSEKLIRAADHFRSLLAPIPRPLISVLVGGKNRHQRFSDASAHDLAQKLILATTTSGGGLAISFSRRTGVRNEAILRRYLEGTPSIIWDGAGENPYFGFLALADAIVVTSDSVSMISEACSTGKPVYIHELPKGGRRHKSFCRNMIQGGYARPFSGTIGNWQNIPLHETRKAADFIAERYLARMPLAAVR